jgi:hypothetical protein
MPDHDLVSHRALARGGLIASALLVALAQAGYGQQNNQTGDGGDSQQRQTKIEQESKPVSPLIPLAIQNDIKRTADALEAANAHPNAATEQQQARDNLKTQQDIAYWARFMFGAALAETTVTFFGVILVGLTLIAARRAATAAESAVSETRRIGEAQVRAYVNIPTVRVQFLDWTPGEAIPSVEIVASNSGQSPARNFLWRPTIQYFSGDQRRQRGLGIVWAEAPGASIPSKESHTSRVMIPDMGIARFAATHISPSGDVLVQVRVEFSYMDVFDQTITEEAYFAGITAWDGEGHAKNEWRSVNLDPLPTIRDWDNTEHFHNQ